MNISDDLLTRAGWQSAEEGTTPTPFEQFASRLGFSLQGELLINPPEGSVGFDFAAPTAGTEFELRRALYDLFREFFLSDICYAIDVNHGEWTFSPGKLNLTSQFEPFPISVTPWAEYVAFGNGDFSHGAFGNPSNGHLVVLGEAFVRRFSALHKDRLVSAQVAATHRRVR